MFNQNLCAILSLKKFLNLIKEIEYLSVVQKERLDNTIFIDLDLPSGFESINPGATYYKDSILPVLIYESSRLLVKYPALNSYFSDGNIVSYNKVDMGIGMDIDSGLKVIKIPQPDKMNLKEIEEKLSRNIAGSTPPPDLSGITFTINDILSNGVYFFTPLTNKYNTSVLGISKVDRKLNRIILSLTFDHNITEGQIAIAFLGELKGRIESYISLQKANGTNLMCCKCMRRISEDMNNKGFVRIMTNKGEEKLICDSCLLNY